MSSSAPRLAAPAAGAHPALLGRRLRDLLVSAFVLLVAVASALGVVAAVPNPNFVLAAALALGALGVVALLTSARYEVSLTLLVLYLGLLDGPVKLLTASQGAAAVRDVLIFAVALSMLARVSVTKERLRLPPLSGWVLAFAAVVLIEALNPKTSGFLKILGGFRQELEWLPFFFFGYMMLRSARRFRQLFLVLGVLAFANGLVGTYQSRLSTGQLAAWGPGYNLRLNGQGGVAPREFNTEGTTRPRPPALGSDSGYGGTIGLIALPGLLALLGGGRTRHRWLVLLLCAGAMAGVGSSASRTSLIAATIAVLAYAGLSLIGGLRLRGSVVLVLAAFALAAGVVTALTAVSGKGVFGRVTGVAKLLEGAGETKAKQRDLKQLPRVLTGAPFGAGLGVTGPASGFGGRQKVRIEGGGAGGESTYNQLAAETGALGLLLWLGLTVNVIALGLTRLRAVMNLEIRAYLVAMLTVFMTFTVVALTGPTLVNLPSAPFLWFAAGVVAYWLAGARGKRSGGTDAAVLT